MSQGNVIEVLQKNKGKWLCSRDIAKILNISQTTISENLKKIYIHDVGLLEREKRLAQEGGYFWKIKEAPKALLKN